jgi:hypothetical protein
MGGETEAKVRDFLNNHMPKRFHATSGFVIDIDNQMSNHQDVIIYDALSSPVYRYEEYNQIVSSDAVASIIEVKSVLNKSHLANSYEKIAEVKRLRKRPISDMDQRATESAMTTTGTLGIILGFTSDITLEKLAEHCVELNDTYDSALLPDMIVLVDVGTINYAVQFIGTDEMQDLAPPGDDEFVIPPCFVHLVARADGAFAVNRLFTHLLSHLAFFPRRPSIPPFSVLLEGTSTITQHMGVYQFNTERRLIRIPSEPSKEQKTLPASPVIKIRDAVTKKELATLTYIQWQDGGVVRKKGEIPLVSLIIWFTNGKPPMTVKVDDHELTSVMKVTREEFEKWPAIISRQSNLIAQLETPPPFEVREIKGMEGTGEPLIARLVLGVMDLAGTAVGLDKRKFDERYSAVLAPVVHMRNVYRELKKTISGHRDALAKGSILKKSLGPDPLLTERIDSKLRNDTNTFLEMAHKTIEGLPIAMKYFKINMDYLLDREQRFANGCEKNEAKGPELVAYLRKLRPHWLDIDAQFKSLRTGGWTLPAVRHEMAEKVVTMIEPQIDGMTVSEYADKIYNVVALAVEELVVYGLQNLPNQVLGIAEIPLAQRVHNNPLRFMRTLQGYEEFWRLKWTGKGFYES